MPTAEQDPQREGLSPEDRRVIEWRYDQLRALGFGEEDAWLLAGASADLHLVRTLVGAGCPQHLVLGIVL